LPDSRATGSELAEAESIAEKGITSQPASPAVPNISLIKLIATFIKLPSISTPACSSSVETYESKCTRYASVPGISRDESKWRFSDEFMRYEINIVRKIGLDLVTSVPGIKYQRWEISIQLSNQLPAFSIQKTEGGRDFLMQ
jgi:hypothetical protein